MSLIEDVVPHPILVDEERIAYLKNQIDYWSREIDNEKAKGAWIESFSGLRVYPLAMTEKMVVIEDIAHALSMKCRYGGHCLKFISVAEHSVYVANVLAQMDKLELIKWGLFHDAAEAYLPDVARPIKDHIQGFRAIEQQCERAIADKFNLCPKYIPKDVKHVDTSVLYREKEVVMRDGPEWSKVDVIPLPDLEIHCWTPEEAEEQFMLMFNRLFRSN